MPQFNLERLLDGLNLHLRVTSMNYAARFLSQIGQFGNFKNPTVYSRIWTEMWKDSEKWGKTAKQVIEIRYFVITLAKKNERGRKFSFDFIIGNM